MTDAVIVDLDGTLCDTSAIAHLVEGDEKDFWAFHQASADAPVNVEVADAVRAAHADGLAVLVVTSREFVWRDLTLDWLVAHDIPYDQLLMRVVADYRPDTKVKADILDGLEADGFTVLEAWEDTDDVAELWSSRGIEVHRV